MWAAKREEEVSGIVALEERTRAWHLLAAPTDVTIEPLGWPHLRALHRFPSMNEALYGERRVALKALRRAWDGIELELAQVQLRAFAIVCREAGAVGVVRLDGLPDRPGEGELGYCIAHSARGRGLATGAAALVLAELAQRGGLERVWAWCAEENSPSIRVLQKLGFTLAEGAHGPEPLTQPPPLLFELPLGASARPPSPEP